MYIAEQIRMLKIFGSIFASHIATLFTVVVVYLVIVYVGVDNATPAASGFISHTSWSSTRSFDTSIHFFSKEGTEVGEERFLHILFVQKEATKITTLCNTGIYGTGSSEVSIKKK